MSKTYRIILFFLSILLLLTISYLITKDVSSILRNFWGSSGILLVILLSLIDQPHFSKDSNILVNAITASISLLLIHKSEYDWLFFTFLSLSLYLLITSYALMWIRNNPLNEENRFVQFFTRINRTVGKPEVLFSAFFYGEQLNSLVYSQKI